MFVKAFSECNQNLNILRCRRPICFSTPLAVQLRRHRICLSLFKDKPNTREKFQQMISDRFRDSHVFYTDGSVNLVDMNVAFSVYAPALNIRAATRISNGGSIFLAEAYGVLTSVQAIRRNEINNASNRLQKHTQLIKYTKFWREHATYYQCNQRKSSQVLRGQKAVTMIWVPGHAGIHGNEIADELATRAPSPMKST